MSDTRTRREKLVAMAAQSASPEEAAVAQRMLREYDEAHPDEATKVASLEDRFNQAFSAQRGWTPGLRVRVVVPDDLWNDPSIDWNGVD